MKETFGVQVFLIVLGYLIITRLNMALRRREDACQGVSFMIENWSDAHSTFVSFIHAAQTKKLSAEKKANLRTAYELITHYFSLMHAIALISLKESESHPYGRISDEGAEAIQKLRPLEEAQMLSQMTSRKKGKRVTQLEVLNDEIELEGFGQKHGWESRMAVIGKLTESELDSLSASRYPIDVVQGWLFCLLSTVIENGMVGSAPPIYSRLYQEIANGMWGYFQALRITQVRCRCV